MVKIQHRNDFDKQLTDSLITTAYVPKAILRYWSFYVLQGISDVEEDPGELSRESIWDLSCETVREQLTNSIRKQWRILKSHVEKLDNQGNYCLNACKVSSDTQ